MSDSPWLVIVMLVVFFVVLGIWIAGGLISVFVVEDKVITIQEKLGAHGNEGQYLVIDTENNVYTVEDNYFLMSFDASNRYAKMRTGGSYLVRTRGIRLPLLTWYPNIMEITQSTSLLTNACYLAGVANGT